MENEPLALEMLKELKAESKRRFIIIIVLIALLFSTIAGFIIYLSLPVEEITTTTTDIEQQADNDGYNQIIGGDFNGGETESASD